MTYDEAGSFVELQADSIVANWKSDGENTMSDGEGHYISLYKGDNGYYLQNGDDKIIELDEGYNAVKIESVDGYNLVLSEVNTDDLAISWSEDIPKKTDVGEYDVYYRIQGGANYENVAPRKIGTAKIDYKPISLTVSNLGKVKVAEYDYATKTEKDEVTATGSQYTLKASKTYHIYTEKSINEALSTKYDLSRKTLSTGDYKYVYTIDLPEVPNATDYPSDAFTLSHTNNYQGKVLDTMPQTELYVADGGVTVTDETTLAATLEGKDTYYYGDTPVFDDVKIKMPDLVKVKEIYLADVTTGARVDLTSANVQYGTYRLTAILTIDNDGDGDFTTKTNQQLSETLRRDVTFAPRPMSENEYYLKTTDDQGKETLTKLAVTPVYKKDGSGKDTEEVDRYEVIVPTDTYTYNSEDQKPDIVVKNPSLGKTDTNPDGTALVIKTETSDGEYTSAVTAHKDAGTYSEKITAVPDVKDATGVTTQANYTGDVTVVWTIKKATANVTVAAKNNIVYDGKNLDGDDFDVKAAAGKEDDALTKEFLETIGKKDSGTTFEVTAAIGDVPKKVDYTAEDMTSAEGETLDYESINNNYVNKVINGNITLSFNCEANKGRYLNVKVQRGLLLDNELIQSYYDYRSIEINGRGASNVNLTYDKTNGTLAIDDHTISAQPGYRLAIGSSTQGYLNVSDPCIDFYIVAVPEKKTTTELKASNIKDANVEGEVKKANVTIKSKNFEDIVYEQKLDNGKVVAGQDNSLTAKTNPRPVTITPKNNNTPFVYGTFVANNDDAKANFYKDYVTYEAEKQDDKKGTGLVTGEEAKADFSSAFKLVETGEEGEKVFKFGDAWANNAGSYKYEVVSGFKVPNYTVTVDKNGEFIVSQKTITKDMFDLYYKGDNNADTKYSTPFIYGGKAYDVFVKGTDKTTVEKTATFTADNFSNGTATVDSVKLTANKATNSLKLYNENQDTRNSLSIEAAATSKVVLTYDEITVGGAAITESTPLNQIISYTGNNVTAKIDTEKKTITLTGDVSSISSYYDTTNNNPASTINLTNVEVTYTADSTHQLASTDFNTIGVLRGILPDTFYVGIEGKGNYTGTLADTATTGKTWAIKDATLNAAFDFDEEFTYTGYSVARKIENKVIITGSAEQLFNEEFKGYKPEITYYVKGADDKYTKLDKAPVEVGKYKVTAKFEAEGFKFNNTDNGVITKEFEIVPFNFGNWFNFTKTYGDIEIPEEKKLEYDITDLFIEKAESNSGRIDYSILSNPLIKALLEKDYVLLSDDELITPVDEQGETTYPVYVAKGKVSVKAEDINKSGKYLNAGEHILDCTGVTVETVEVTINRETNEVTIGEEFTPTKNVIVDGTVLTVDKLKLTKDMFKAFTALIADGKAYLTKIVSVADDYTDLMKASDYAVVGNQSTAVTGTTNVQITATSEGNFKGTAKVSGVKVVDSAEAIKFTTTIDTAVNPNKPDAKYVRYKFDKTIADDVEISAVGYVYVNDTVDELTVDTAGATVKSVETTNKSGFVRVAVEDTGKGTTAVGFVVINGEYIYSDVESKTYDQVTGQPS